MATTITRFRAGWGLVDFEFSSAEAPQYGATQFAYAGPSAAAGVGIGVRRATLIFNRNAATPADDAINCHFDFLNLTGGDPDDTWTTADFTTLETALLAWHTGMVTFFPSYAALERIAWHRVGPGVVLPNPAERILDLATPVVGTGLSTVAPQLATTLTLRTGIRRSWGRTYIPFAIAPAAMGRVSTGNTDFVVSTGMTLLNAARSADFLMGVTSLARSSFLAAEALESDSTIDIVRRRRWKHTAYKKITPVT